MPTYANPYSPSQWMGLYNKVFSPNLSSPYANYLENMPAFMRRGMDNNEAFKTWTGFWGQSGKGQNYFNWLDNQFNPLYSQYASISPFSPNTDFSDYLGQINPNKMFSMSSPFSRGERANLYAPTLRMMR